ncbi:MAG: ferritin [Planctomycetota bacterium]|nr:ferritin [Planctomycetota bacterium]
MLSEIVQKALNDQINMEFTSSYTYLAMSSYCGIHNFPGCANWLLLQSQEENDHAMRLRSFLLDRDCPVVLRPIEAPKADFATIPEVFQCALENEIAVSASIDRLYELAHNEKAFAALVELQWFISEQVEEEKTVRDIAARFQILKDDPSALIDLDRDLGERSQASASTEI